MNEMKNLRPFDAVDEKYDPDLFPGKWTKSDAKSWIKSVMNKAEDLSGFLIDHLDEMDSKLDLDLAHMVMAEITRKRPENVYEAAVMAALRFNLEQYIDDPKSAPWANKKKK